MKKIFFIISGICFFISCKKEANVKLPETKPLPVFYSYICPTDTVIRLKLYYSSPLYGGSKIDIQAAVPGADVSISSAQGTAKLTFNKLSQYYEVFTSAYPVIPGQKYKVTVITDKGEMATAETEVPLSAVPIRTVTVLTLEENFGKSDQIKMQFNDVPGQENYYRMAGTFLYKGQFQGDTAHQDMFINELHSDQDHDGEQITMESRFYQQIEDSAEYDLYLYNCSYSYFQFNKSLLNYSGDNPFSEPTLIYNNVKGGFGCFAAYTRSKFEYRR